MNDKIPMDFFRDQASKKKKKNAWVICKRERRPTPEMAEASLCW